MYELVDSTEPGAKVGVRKIGDPLAPLFTPQCITNLENVVIQGSGTWGTKGAVVWRDGQYQPNQMATKSSKIENEENFFDIVE